MADTYTDLFWAYTALWTVIVIFLVLLARHQSQLKKKIDRLQTK